MGESEKVGRTLSAATLKKIQAAMDALHELMGGGQPDAEPKEEDDEEPKAVKAMMKKEADGEHPAGHYLVTEDPESPSTWHLRVKGMDGKPDHGLMGAAWAALHDGFRGNKYQGPNKAEAVAKLKRMYDAEGMEPPGGKSVEVDDLLTVKALGAGRVGAYAVLWGDAGRRDLTNEYFTPETAELTALFKAMGKLPLLYHHAGDDALKTAVVGMVDILQSDDVGLWYEAQREKSHAYRGAIDKLIADGALGTSTGTLPRARQVKDGQITRWPIAEISLTPTPAEPRMMDRPVAEIKAAYKAIGLDFPEEPDARGAEDARQKEIELEQERLALLEI